MERFTTRVELHDAAAADYQTLHQAMKQEGFSQTITSDDGIEYQFPTAEYNKEGEFSKHDVLESAKRAARKTNKSHSILVTKSAGRTWHNLQRK